MISAEVIKGVKELLEAQGVVQKSDERFGDFVARGLGISARQTEILSTRCTRDTLLRMRCVQPI